MASECRFFFFQAEDGIRDLIVTGVQTCALPIYRVEYAAQRAWDEETGQKLLQRRRSEPELFLELLRRLQWSCLVCLVGPGQEINRGEGGMALWGAALDKQAAAGRAWRVVAAGC